MMWWSGSWGWAAWLGMSLAMLAFWAIVVWLIVITIRGSSWGAPWGRPRSADELLDERFARGEIDEDEYRHRRDLLSSRK